MVEKSSHEKEWVTFQKPDEPSVPSGPVLKLAWSRDGKIAR